MDFIYYFGIGINFFLLLVLIAKRGKTIADKILAAWLFVIGIHLTLFVITLQPINSSSIHWMMGTAAPVPLIHGPFLYLYTAASTNLLPRRKGYCIYHFIPFFLTILYLMPLYLMSGQEKMEIYLNSGRDYRLSNLILGIIVQLSGVLYVIWSFILLNRHKKNIGEQFSYEEKINLNWLRYLIYAVLVIWIIVILLKKNTIIFGASVLFVTMLGFLGIRQVGIFVGNSKSFPEDSKQKEAELNEELIPAMPEPEVENKTPVIETEERIEESKDSKKKYATSGLSPELAVAVQTKLTTAMEEQKLYTEPELSLSMLAEKLDIHPNYLSQVINEKEGKSFFDYINNLRVEEFKRLVSLPENAKFTMLSLAFECGFNSKSSFNKNFKRVTGQSPSEYIAKQTNQG